MLPGGCDQLRHGTPRCRCQLSRLLQWRHASSFGCKARPFPGKPLTRQFTCPPAPKLLQFSQLIARLPPHLRKSAALMRRWCCDSHHSNTLYASAPFIVFTAIADRPLQIVMLLAHPETAPGLSSSAEVCFHCAAAPTSQPPGAAITHAMRAGAKGITGQGEGGCGRRGGGEKRRVNQRVLVYSFIVLEGV